MTANQIIVTLVVTSLTLFTYFIPTVIAACRGTKRGAGIFILNLFTGWTFLGWVISLVWAVSESKA